MDDDVVVRELYGRALRGAGFVVEEAPTLGAALDLVERVAPDVVVLDRDLPDGDGFGAVRALRRNRRRPDVPVIAFTSHVGADARRAAFAAGCVDFVSKPCAPPSLVRHVLDAVGPPSSPPMRAREG